MLGTGLGGRVKLPCESELPFRNGINGDRNGAGAKITEEVLLAGLPLTEGGGMRLSLIRRVGLPNEALGASSGVSGMYSSSLCSLDAYTSTRNLRGWLLGPI